VSLAEYAAKHGLERVGARPPLGAYLKETIQRLNFAWMLSAYGVQSGDARTRLGNWWLLLLPTIQAGLYGLIFGLIIGSNRPENFLAYLFTGVFLFSFMSGSLQTGATAVIGNAGLVKSLSFPRILLPLSAVIKQTLNFWPQILLLVVTLLATYNWPSWDWLLVIPVVVLMTMFSLGVALIAARLTVQFRDLNKMVPLITRLLFYVSGVFFSLERVLGQWPVVYHVFAFNPFYDFIQLTRGLMVNGYEPSALLWIQCIVWAIVTPLIGIVYFWRAEEQYGRED
jgi:teichoic acid transport system permease protein